MTQRRVTIRDVAAAAGVSITTVSHVLNDVPGKRISSVTRERVTEAARTLGYQPNALAKGLRTQRSNTIGIIGDDVVAQFAGQMITCAQEIAWERDAVALVVSTGYQPDVERRGIEELRRRQVDGVLYAAMYHREVEIPAELDGIPTVVVNASCTASGVPWVTPDEVAGGRDAATVLLDAGHRRVAMINSDNDIPAAVGRRRGFLERLAESGVADPAVIVTEPEPRGGYAAAYRLLAPRGRLLAADQRPTGIFCFSDPVAIGVYRAAMELGLRVPADLSVIGFDNREYIADGVFPGLTTIELPHYDMSVWATEQLFALIGSGVVRTPADATPTERLPGPVIHRDSVAPPLC